MHPAQPNQPTIEQAAAYVTQTEASWGLESRILLTGIDADGFPSITTANTAPSYWTVWFESDGTIYGEC